MERCNHDLISTKTLLLNSNATTGSFLKIQQARGLRGAYSKTIPL